MKNNSTTYIPKIFETSKYVFFWYYTVIVEQRIVNLYGFLFDKNTNTKYKFDVGEDRKIKIKDDLSGGPDFNIEFRDNRCSNGKLFSFAEALTLKKYVDSENFKDAKARDPKKKSELNLRNLAMVARPSLKRVLPMASECSGMSGRLQASPAGEKSSVLISPSTL